MSRGLLVIDRTQFGYLTDSLKWCEFEAKNMPVHYVCFDYGKPKYDSQGVQVKYVARKGLKSIRAFKLIFKAILAAMFHRGPIIVVSFPKCELIKRCLPWKKMNLDIRTMSINPDAEIRQAMNAEILRQSHYFDSTSVITNEVAQAIGIKNALILPLGADVISSAKKVYTDAIRLIYIGTFYGRRIEDTVKGVSLFMKEHPEVPISYDIFGGGDDSEVQLVNDAIKQADTDAIRYNGRKSHQELKTVMDKSNVGFSYVPLTDYYDLQPPTKTYEYAMSGLFTIGTSTSANRSILDTSNGILVKDSPEAIADGLWQYWQQRDMISEPKIRGSLNQYSWSNICNEFLSAIIYPRE